MEMAVKVTSRRKAERGRGGTERVEGGLGGSTASGLGHVLLFLIDSTGGSYEEGFPQLQARVPFCGMQRTGCNPTTM